MQIDEEEKKRLLSVTSSISIPSLNIHLKPWLYNNGNENVPPHNVKFHLRPITLYALYKCMACIYSTNDRDKMLLHMVEHEKLVSLVKTLGKTEWLECAYCAYVALTRHLIVKHTEVEHSNTSYQCAYCYYRTIEVSNLVYHMTQYHNNKEKNVLFVCNNVPTKFVNDLRNELRKNRRKYVPAYICNEGGNFHHSKH